MMKSIFLVFSTACATACATAQDSGSPQTDTALPCATAPRFTPDIYPVFYEVCAACHYIEPAGLAFVDEDPTVMLVGVPASQVPELNRVEPGDPEASYLWHKLGGTHLDVGGEGDKMPEAEDFDSWDSRHLTEAELADIELWITCGAG